MAARRPHLPALALALAGVLAGTFPVHVAAQGRPSITWYQVHGWLMYGAFGVLIPLAIFWVRFAKRYTAGWVHLHWILNTLATAAVTASFAIAVYKNLAGDIRLSNTHATLGVAIFSAVALNWLAGVIMRPRPASRLRMPWFIQHWTIGMGALALGWYNIFKGIDYYQRDWHRTIRILENLFAIQIAVMSAAYLLLDRLENKWLAGRYSAVSGSKGALPAAAAEPTATGYRDGYDNYNMPLQDGAGAGSSGYPSSQLGDGGYAGGGGGGGGGWANREAHAANAAHPVNDTVNTV